MPSLLHAIISFTNFTSVQHYSDVQCIACSRVHDRTVMPSLLHAIISFTNFTSAQHYSDVQCIACSRVHDRTVSHIRYLPDEGLIATLAFDNTLRIFNAIQATLRCTVVNDTGGPFTGMEHDPVRSQVCSGPFPSKIRAVPMWGFSEQGCSQAGLSPCKQLFPVKKLLMHNS